MILVDFREDSKNKAGEKRGLWDDLKKTSLPIEQAKLEFGDLMFIGNGPEGEVTVGIEFKKIRDLLQSIRTGRYQGHQLLGMQSYDFRYLLVEGDYRSNEQGLVTLRAGHSVWKPAPGRMASAELDKTLIGLPLRAGTLVWRTGNRADTVAWITHLYRNWTDKPWDAHTSHVAIYRPPTLVPISDYRTTVSTFPGIGVKTSKLVERHFSGNLRKTVTAPIHEWGRIEGIGLKTAERIVDYLGQTNN